MVKIKEKNKIDMLNGSIVDKLFIFAIPLAITSSLQQLFNAADIVVCGRFVGSVALAAVGANSQIVNLFVNSFLGLTLGVNVMIASYIGEGKKEKIYNVVHTAITFAFIFGMLLLTIGILFAKNILIFLGTPDDILKYATLYLQIYFIGMPFFVVYNFGAAILRSVGDTKRPLMILTITGILNVILNVFLVVCFNLGVAGVAIATSVSNAISAIFVLYLLVREKGVIRLHLGRWMINIEALSRVMKVGIPSAIQGMVFSISNLCVQSAVNSLGTNTIAANATAVYFEIFPLYIFSAFGNACVTFMSQNFGAKKYDRCKNVYKYCLIFGSMCSLLLTIMLQIPANYIIKLFTVDLTVISIAMIRVRYVGCFAWIQTVFDTSGAALRALRHPILPAVMVILGTVVFRIVWCMTVFPLYSTYKTVAIVYPLSWVIIDIAMVISYIIISKKELSKT